MLDLHVAPAPWKLKGRAWIFGLSGLRTKANFPAGFSANYQAEALAGGGEFIGGLGLVQILSYSDSPVGPYDELIYAPGRWKYADGDSAFRITRIYVSTKESTANGRRNWNIPKQVANFDIKAGPSGTWNISVTLPGALDPLFKASTKPVSVISSIPLPFNSSMLGVYFCIIQPPLPAGPHPEEVETPEWAQLIPGMKGNARLTWITPEINGKMGNGVDFPAIVPWSSGVYIDKLEVDFGVATFHKTR